MARKASKEPIPKELYDILACPVCKANVRYNGAKTALKCVKCGNTYPIKGGIPVMLPPDMQA